MEIKGEIKVQEDKLLESLTDEEKKQRLAQEVANKLLIDIQFELYMDAIDGGKI